MLNVYILMFCRIAIALIFALAFIGKIQDVKAFQETIIDFRILPTRWSPRVAWGFLTTELVISLFIIVGGNMLLPGFLLAVGLLVLFSIVLILVLHRKMNVACNCFGWTERGVSPYDIARNTLFILCSLIGVWICMSTSQNLLGSDIILVGFMAIYFVVLVNNLVEVIETLRQPFKV